MVKGPLCFRSNFNEFEQNLNSNVKSEVLRRGPTPHIHNNFCLFCFNVAPYFNLKKNFHFILDPFLNNARICGSTSAERSPYPTEISDGQLNPGKNSPQTTTLNISARKIESVKRKQDT